MSRELYWLVVATIAVLASCNVPQASDNDPVAAEPVEQGTPITMRSMAGEPEQILYLVEPKRHVPLGELAAGLREAGFHCEALKDFKQLQQNGERMDVYKADCLKESYQVTLINGNSHIKPWTGNLLGS